MRLNSSRTRPILNDERFFQICDPASCRSEVVATGLLSVINANASLFDQEELVQFNEPWNVLSADLKNPAVFSRSPIRLNFSLLSSRSGDEEEFTGIAEPSSSSVLSDLIYPTSTSSQRISYVILICCSLWMSHLIVSHSLKRTVNNNIPAEEAEQQQLQETVRDLKEKASFWCLLFPFKVDELQKTVEVLTGQKQKTTDRLAKIQSENSDLKSRSVSRERKCSNERSGGFL